MTGGTEIRGDHCCHYQQNRHHHHFHHLHIHYHHVHHIHQGEEKKVIIEGEDFCEDVFDAFVRKGEAVGIDEAHVKTYCPVRARQTVMRIIFYCTDAIDSKFVDDAEVK